MRVILASNSPRRRELLGRMGVEFEVIPSNFDEQLDDTRSAEEVAAELSLGKALDVARSYPDAYVIGSDTIVAVDDTQLAKPSSPEEARRMLKSLSGREHKVVTGIALVNLSKNLKLAYADWSHVYFKPYDAALVEEYIASGDPYDKAGAYGIQSGAAPLISHIEGYYDTIVGLPTRLLAAMLQDLGIPAQPAPMIPPVRHFFGGDAPVFRLDV